MNRNKTISHLFFRWKPFLLALVVFVVLPICGKSQSVGFIMPSKFKSVEIPFTYQNNFIVLDIRLQGFFPLKFIYDTGAETTILTTPRIAELLEMRYTRKFEIMGSDMEKALTAYLIKDVLIGFDQGTAPTQDILVFDRDYFNLEEFIGEDVHGIIGGDIFRNYIVSIDYISEKLIIYKKDGFKPSKKFTAFPLIVEKNKPYIYANITVAQNHKINGKILIDSGAALSLLVDADEEKGLGLPEKTIRGRLGFGIGGELEGYVGRIAQLQCGPFNFNDLITNFRVFDDMLDSLEYGRVDRKDGLIGNEILQNFRCVFDFPNKTLYLKPYHKNYQKRVAFDRSGMNLIMVGKNLQQIMINNVFEGSPADLAGLKKGDIIRAVNGIPVLLLSYGNIVQKFKKSGKKKFKVKVNRQGSVFFAEFFLRDLI